MSATLADELRWIERQILELQTRRSKELSRLDDRILEGARALIRAVADELDRVKL